MHSFLKQKRAILIFALVGLLVFSWAGCAPGGYGKLGMAAPEMTIGTLVKDWKDYNVSYAGVRVSLPNAILFDPKKDDKTITLHKYWAPVEDQETLGDLLSWINVFKWTGPPKLYKIMGPDNQVFGYLYALYNDAIIKVIDENTIWIDDMTWRYEDISTYTN
ncbi:hypothetical protein ACFL4N_06900 [Thermodesulfobacteriota bacterium]